MANIDAYLRAIASSVYGKDMRSAIHDSIKAVNDQADGIYRELRYSQYTELSSDEKMNGTLYFTTDTKQIFKSGIEYTQDNNVTGSKSGYLLYFNAASAPLEVLNIRLRPKQNTNGYGQVWGPGKGKNKLQLSCSSTTIDGLTFTVTNDSRVIVNGTAEAKVEFTIGTYSYTGELKEFYMNGCPSGGGANSYRLNVANLYDYGNNTTGVKCNLAPDVTHTFKIIVSAGVTVDHIEFKPMLRLTGNEVFVPYSNVCQITKNRALVLKDLAKNLFNKNNTSHYNNYIVNTRGEKVAKSGEGYYYGIPIAPDNAYTFSGSTISDDAVGYLYTFDEAENVLAVYGPLTYADFPYTFKATPRARYFGFSYQSSALDLNTIQLEVGTVASDYMAYTNHSYTLNTGINTWGGLWRVEGGVLEEEWAEIASYAGETLPDEWMSSMDNYSEGGTPTTGAQVVYKTGTKVPRVTGITTVSTLRGINTMWSPNNQEKIAVTYTNEAWQDIVHYKELENEEYQAMSETDQNNGVLYFITDKGVIYLNGVVYGAGSGGGMSFSRMAITDRSASTSHTSAE